MYSDKSSHLSEHIHYTISSYQGDQHKTVTETFNKVVWIHN